MGNFVINIFQEQFNLIDNLPDNEKKEVLYYLIQSKFNQDDCFEKQSSLSLSISLSKLSLSVIDIINKTMRVKEINDNHGGARKGAGAKKGNQNAIKEKQSKNNQETIKLIEKENNQVNIPDWLLRTDSYDELTVVQKSIYDDPEMRATLNMFWAGKNELKPIIGNLYIKILERMQKNKPSVKFIKPTIENIRSYCKERGNSVDAEKWLSYYESNGWKVGKNPMKDWKAAVRTWEKSGFNNQIKPKNIYLEQDSDRTFLKSETNYGDNDNEL